MRREVVVKVRLATELVDALKHLVTRSVTETGEEREELGRDVGGRLVLEHHLRHRQTGRLVRHESLGHRVDRVEDEQFSDARQTRAEQTRLRRLALAARRRWRHGIRAE
ncbi:hypothetical protein L1887_53949 [Cichorium endivia]|nr:hypothetical protein L1887_53949 [Cichorium endivia]